VRWLRTGREPTLAVGPVGIAELAMLVGSAAGGGWDPCEQLVDALARIDADGDREASRAALATFGTSPRAVVRTDQHVRYVPGLSAGV
jgi:hypothetical protein